MPAQLGSEVAGHCCLAPSSMRFLPLKPPHRCGQKFVKVVSWPCQLLHHEQMPRMLAMRLLWPFLCPDHPRTLVDCFDSMPPHLGAHSGLILGFVS